MKAICIMSLSTVTDWGLGGIRGRVLKVVELESRAPHCCGFESHQRLRILQCVGGSTRVPACALNNTHEVFLHQ